jgi:hypothetical protein
MEKSKRRRLDEAALDANNNTLVTVTATAVINTYFIRILGSAYNTLSVNASATAQRNPMVMSLVLDVSYSMEKNGGSGALPTAVNNFIADFNGTSTDSDTIDTVSVVTFGTSATTTVPNASPFQSKISAAMRCPQISGRVELSTTPIHSRGWRLDKSRS